MRTPNANEEALLSGLEEAEQPIRRMRREGKSWSEVEDTVTRQVGYDRGIIKWAREVYNDEAKADGK